MKQATPEQFNSPSPQKKLYLKEKIPVVTKVQKQLSFSIKRKCPQCLKKKLWPKPINQSQVFNSGPPPLSPPNNLRH